MYRSHYSPPAAIANELDTSHRLSEWLQGQLSEEITLSETPNRDTVSLAFFSLALDYRESIITLVAVDARSAAQALQRSLLEAFVRGVWFHEVATDKQVDDFLAGTYAPQWAGMIKGFRDSGSPFAHSLDSAFKTLSDYAHGSRRLLSRWRGPEGIAPRHRDAEMVEALRFANRVGLMAATKRESFASVSLDPYFDKLREHAAAANEPEQPQRSP